MHFNLLIVFLYVTRVQLLLKRCNLLPDQQHQSALFFIHFTNCQAYFQCDQESHLEEDVGYGNRIIEEAVRARMLLTEEVSMTITVEDSLLRGRKLEGFFLVLTENRED